MLEMMISVSLFVVIMLASIGLIEHDRKLSRSTVHMSQVEHMAQQMLFRLEGELANAFGEEPIAVAPVGLNGGATNQLQVDSTLGFPPEGLLVIDRGEATEERIAYEGLEDGQVFFQNLERGLQCTFDVTHPVQAEVLWAGLAEPLEQQSPPPGAGDFDGIALESGGPLYFRGDGIGFSYRIPVDPDGGQDYINGDDLNWGANIPGVGPTLDGWSCLYFQAKDEFVESLHGDDINLDGDTDDVYDIGQIRQVVWDVTDPDVPSHDLGLGPTAVFQERCNYGGDLDNDGFDDPIFLWNQETNELHVRLFLIGTSVSNQPVTRMVESVMFLRNEPEL